MAFFPSYATPVLWNTLYCYSILHLLCGLIFFVVLYYTSSLEYPILLFYTTSVPWNNLLCCSILHIFCGIILLLFYIIPLLWNNIYFSSLLHLFYGILTICCCFLKLSLFYKIVRHLFIREVTFFSCADIVSYFLLFFAVCD